MSFNDHFEIMLMLMNSSLAEQNMNIWFTSHIWKITTSRAEREKKYQKNQ